VQVERVTTQEANAILERGHYLGAMKAGPRYCIATPDRQAIAVYTSPISHELNKRLRAPGGEPPLELARLWRADDADFPTSQFLAATLRWLKAETTAACCLSYADPAQRGEFNGRPHTGIVYQATNWIFLGTSRVTDTWFDTEGRKITAPECFRLYKTKSRTKLAKLGLRLKAGEPKYLYVMPLRLKWKKLAPLFKGTRYNDGPQPYPSEFL
jgi:hypothetical protein